MRMKVLGLREALEHSIIVHISSLDVAFASPAGMAILKLIAWGERRHEVKEKADFAFILTHYERAGNEERLYEEGQDLLQATGFNADLAAARLLGRDMVRIMRPDTKTEIVSLLERHADPEKNDELIIGLRNQLPGKNYEAAAALIESLRKGIQEI